MIEDLEENVGVSERLSQFSPASFDRITPKMYSFACDQLQQNLNRRDRLMKSVWYQQGDLEFIGFVKDAKELIRYWQGIAEKYEGIKETK